jgi:hypothetical protein
VTDITQSDREALERLDDALGFLTHDEREIVLEAFAAHRIAAIEDAAKVADRAAAEARARVAVPGDPYDGAEDAAEDIATAIRALTNQPRQQEG